jgi:hypothetical protein
LPPALSPPTVRRAASMPRSPALAATHLVAVFGREAIVDRDHDQLAFMGELLADHLMGIKIADHPAAAVEEHQAGREPVDLAQRLRGVDAGRDRAVRRRDRQRLGRFKRGRLGIGDDSGGAIIFACFRRGQCLVGGTACLLERLVDGGGIGIENDGHGRQNLVLMLN